MQRRHHNLRCRNLFPVNIHVVDRNTTPVVDHRNRVIQMDRDFYLVSMTCQRLVNRVVHDLVHKMMQTHLARRSDVHRRTLAHRLHAAQHLDRICGVIPINRFAVLVFTVDAFRISVSRLNQFGLQFFRSHFAPCKSRIYALGYRVDSATANWYNLLNFLLFSDQLHSGYFTTNSALFEVGTETVNCLLCSTLGRSFRRSRLRQKARK